MVASISNLMYFKCISLSLSLSLTFQLKQLSNFLSTKTLVECMPKKEEICFMFNLCVKSKTNCGIQIKCSLFFYLLLLLYLLFLLDLPSKNVNVLKESVKNKSLFYLFLIDRWELVHLIGQNT